MGLWRKIRLPDTQFLQNEYLRASFFPIDPYSSFYTLFAANLVSHNSVFLHRPKTQNAHGGRNVMPRCLSEGVDIFLKSADRQGESGHDVRVSRSAPWMARVGGPVMMRTAVSLFIRKFTSGDLTSRHVYRMLREFVDFMATLRYEPCTQFINVSQRALHIYFIDGCRVCPVRPDARYIVKNKNSDL